MKKNLQEYYLKENIGIDGLSAIKNLLLNLNECNIISEIHILDKNMFFQIFFDKITVLKIQKSYIKNNLRLGINSIAESNKISLLTINSDYIEDKLNKFYGCIEKDELDYIYKMKRVFLESPIDYGILNKIETNENIIIIHHDAQSIFIIRGHPKLE